jgi:anion-transporting  ArsA/GET3 family ATPase
MRDLERLLTGKEIAVVCGSGGVGKTTTAAALGLMMAVHTNARVLVLTVDPARRLAGALGLEAIGNTEVAISPERFAAAGLEPHGQLVVAMLDTKKGWDDLIARHAPSVSVRDAILANPVYDSISARFIQSHDYLAAERLAEIHASGRYDLVIVDTPPSQHALDILDAPRRMAEFFSSRLLRWLTVPARSRLLTLASRPFYQVADRVLGSQFLEDIVEFFSLLQTMERGFVERALGVQRLLEDRRTTFVVVSTLESAPAAEAEYFIRELERRRLTLGALVLNKVLPVSLGKAGVGRTAGQLRRQADDLGARLAGPLGEPGAPMSPALVASVLAALADNASNMQTAARREAELRAELSVAPDVTVSVAHLDGSISDLATLAQLGERMWG